MEVNLSEKIIIITGANAGIGYETALNFAKRGAQLILACRNQKKAEEACEKIKNESKNEKCEIELVDLASLKSIREFCERIKKKLTRIDILVNNAGLLTPSYKKTEEGFEYHFGVNHLGPYLLTRLLLDLIKQSQPSRIINVSSSAHQMGKLNWNDLQAEKKYDAFDCYATSKLANILFTVELDRRLKGTDVSVVSLHPGLVKTDLFTSEGTSFGCFTKFITFLANTFGKTAAQGAETTIYCAVSSEIQNLKGKYFSDCRVTQAASKARDAEAAKKLWNVSAKLVNLEED